MLRALKNAGTGCCTLAAGGDGGQDDGALGPPRDERLEDEVEDEGDMEF